MRLSRVVRWGFALLLLALAMLAAWRISTDAWGGGSVRLRPDAHALGSGPYGLPMPEGGGAAPAARVRLARTVLAYEPLDSRAYAVIAAEAPTGRVEALHRVAVRRAPRLIAPRVWLANHGLRTGDFRDAMRHIDVLLRLSPPYRAYLFPRLAALSVDPAFAAALATTLRSNPPWRAEFIAALQADDPGGTRRALLAKLAGGDAMDGRERDRWISGLIQQQRWAEAYAQWARSVHPGATRIPAIADGGFAKQPVGRGFDWHIADVAGAHLEFTRATGTDGLAAHVEFAGRPAAGAGLEHPLFLGPGRYRLQARVRAAALQGFDGLQFAIACGTRTQVVARSAPMRGSFDWRAVALDFSVPVDGCAGQWLQLLNPVPTGAAQVMSGEIWVDDVHVVAVDSPGRSGVAVLRAADASVMRGEGADFVRVRSGTQLAAGDRLLLLSDTGAKIAFDTACTEPLSATRVLTVDRARCGRTRPTAPARPSGAGELTIAVLPEALTWPLPPIGR